MIYENDAKKFASMIKITWQSCGRNQPDKETMSYWFNKLSVHDFNIVEVAFDDWLKSQSDLPMIKDILNLCKPKPVMYAALTKHNNIENNKLNIEKLNNYVAKELKPKTDYKDWARKIIANPKNYPDISLRYAKEALNAN